MLNLIRTLHLCEFLDERDCVCRIEIVATLCNNPQAKGIQALQDFHIPCLVLSHKGLEREVYDALLVREIRRYEPALCVLSGFMRILTPIFTQHSGTIIAQEKLPKVAGESFEDFEARIHELEYKLFPQAILRALALHTRG